jgi:uncharacterized PurR-regulated membrane protein YhhQ (DUF165 family)
MRTNLLEDPWLSPTWQADYPTREILPESRLHARRERTFLVLAGLYLLAVIAAPLLGTSRVIDLAYVVGLVTPDLAPAVPMHLPIGVLLLPVALVALDLASELYGGRRIPALMWAGLAATLAAVGMARVSDQLGGVDAANAAFGPALGFAAYYVVAHLTNLSVFGILQRRAEGHWVWPRALLAAGVGAILGWSAFAGALYGYHAAIGTLDTAVIDGLVAIAVGSAAYVAVCAPIAALIVSLAVRALAPYLRVTRFADDDAIDVVVASPGTTMTRIAPATVVGVPAAPVAPPVRHRLQPALLVESSPVLPRVRRNSLQPFNSAEMRFFTEGDELEAETEAEARASRD